MPQRREWFGEWFDSPYYHVLYQERDHKEAQEFIENLIDELHLAKDHKILDVACGKGRHSIYLNQKGFNVVGVDLSTQNIQYARQFENERLHFDVHDMRLPYAQEQFDIVLNLFTSFGYFNTEKENEIAICAIAKSIKPGGLFLLDFLNPYTVVHNLRPAEVKLVQGIEFHISRHLSEDNFILKDIDFSDNGKSYHFQEKVKAIRRMEFLKYFEEAGLTPQGIYGSYQFDPYVAERSARMIFVVRKD